MILEERSYLPRPGCMAEYLRHVEETGLPVMREVQAGLVGYFTVEAGDAARVVHLWAYEDLADRAERRARLDSDPRWIRFLGLVTPLLASMETRILRSAGINPVTLEMIRAANGRPDEAP